MVGVHGRLYDVTEFMHRHPGSPETLMDNAGADATEFFEDVGHSKNARDLMTSLDSLAPASYHGPRVVGRSRSLAGSRGGGGGGGIFASAMRNATIQLGSGGTGGFGGGFVGGSGRFFFAKSRREKSRPSPRDLRCVLASTREMLQRARVEAGARGKNLFAPSAVKAKERREADWAGNGGHGDGDGDGDGDRAVDPTRSDGHDRENHQGSFFWCHDCEQRFDPAISRESGKDRRGLVSDGQQGGAACDHMSGTLRVFYVPMRAQWCGFYSCCREHVLLTGGARK